MKIKKVSQVSKVKKTSYLLDKAKEHKKNTYEKSYRHNQNRKKTPLTIEQHLTLLKKVVSIYHNNLTVANAYEYTDPERIKRAKEQLRVYFLNSFSRGVFHFVVKSSGLTPQNESYFVKLQFKELTPDNPHLDTDIKTLTMLLNNTRIGIECSCEDFQYRFRYWITQMKALPKGAIKEFRYPKITNPNGEHQFLCKHIVLVLNAIQKPSFRDGIFKRYVNNLINGRERVRVKKEDKTKTLQASHKMKVKGIDNE